MHTRGAGEFRCGGTLPSVTPVGRQPTTKLQASGHRFLTRRLEIALLNGDVDAAEDPVRSPSTALAAGTLLACAGVVVAVVLAFLRPAPGIDDAPIVLDRDSGALYVRVGAVLHPVFNLSSARLIAGNSASPVPVARSVLASLPRGPLLGIPGAPAVLAPQLTEAESGWTVCDTGSGATSAPASTIVIAGREGTPTVGGSDALLVTTGHGPSATTYLVYDGHRAAVDVDDPAVTRALQLDGVAPRFVSPGFLSLVPELPAIVAPRSEDFGSSAGTSLPGFPVGSVIVTNTSSDPEHYVVLADGLQAISQVVADLIRAADSRGSQEIVAVAPDAVVRLPRIERLSVTTYPDRLSTLLGADGPPVVCAQWAPAVDAPRSAVWLADAPPVPSPDAVVPLVQADGAGPAVDGTHVPAGRSVFVAAAGMGDVGTGVQQLHLITETGVCFGVADETDVRRLGLTMPAVAAPSAILRLLPRGPALSRADALIGRDSVWGTAGVAVEGGDGGGAVPQPR